MIQYKEFLDYIKQTDSQPKNPPHKRLSKKQFYKLLERNPLPLITNSYDETVTLNRTQVVWFPQCKKPLPLKEVMKLREKYFPNPYPKEPITRNLPAQGSTSCMHPEHVPYYLKGRVQGTPANTDWRLYERIKKRSRGLIPASRAPKAFIEYNPEEHHDILVEYLVDAWYRHHPLDFPYLPHQFDGTPNFAINKDDTWYLFHGYKLWLELISDASDWYHKIMEFEKGIDSLRCRDVIEMEEMDILKMKDYDKL